MSQLTKFCNKDFTLLKQSPGDEDPMDMDPAPGANQRPSPELHGTHPASSSADSGLFLVQRNITPRKLKMKKRLHFLSLNNKKQKEEIKELKRKLKVPR